MVRSDKLEEWKNKTDSKTFAYIALLVATQSWRADKMNAPTPANHMSRNDPPKARGHMSTDRKKSSMHLKRTEESGGAAKRLLSCSAAFFRLISSWTTDR